MVSLLTIVFLVGCARTVITSRATETACRARLSVSSTPPGAEVTVDGVSQGVTPLDLSLAPGTATVQLLRDGYAPVRRTVRLSCDQPTDLSLTLQDVRAPLVQLAAPAGPVPPGAGLKASASVKDNGEIVRLQLLVDGQVVAEAAESSLRHNVDTRSLAPGVHQLEARAWDAAGMVGVSKAAFVVAEPTATATATTTATPTATPTPNATVTASALTVATVGPSPTPTPVQRVAVSRRMVTIDIYAYRQVLYTDEAKFKQPYPLLGEGWGAVAPHDYELIVLRNEYLEVELLPELGGRIYQIRYLPTDQTLLYNNKVIKPTRWGPADQGWWLAVGGAEFCLPVDEHGYVTAEPWSASVSELDDGSATVTMTLVEHTRQVAVEVNVTLRPGEAAVDVGSRLTSQSNSPESLQYWINTMVSPGKHGVGSGLRLVLPGTQVQLHSTGLPEMPAEYETLPWPVYQGTDLSRYRNWSSYLGLFMPKRTADFVAVYDDDTAIGLVRVYPRSVAKGLKVFGFGRGFDTNIYTDDGSQYLELWSGLTPTFKDYATLAPGASVFWRETWYPIVAMSGPSLANAQMALYAERNGDRLTVHAHAIREQQVALVVSQGDQELSRQTMVISPNRPLHLELGLRGNLRGDARVMILRPSGEVIIDQTVPSPGG